MASIKARAPEEMRVWSRENRIKRYPRSRKVRAMLGLRPPIREFKGEYMRTGKRKGGRAPKLDLSGFRRSINLGRGTGKGYLAGLMNRFFQRKAS